LIQSPGFVLTILAFILVIGPLVFVHEMGHYLAGRWFGVQAEAFSIGFGHEIAGWTDKRGTRWKLGWLPLGGYVKFAGDMNPASVPTAEWLALPAAERQRTFQAKPVWQRAIIVAAGPLVNFLLAILILAGFAATVGVDRTPPVVGTIAANSPAAAAGLRTGDRITALGGRSVETYRDLQLYVVMRPGERVPVDFVRAGTTARVNATFARVRMTDRFGNETAIGRLGVSSGRMVYELVPLLEAPAAGVRMVGDILRGTFDGLGQIITGRRSLDELGGPLRIAKVSGEQLALGWTSLVLLLAFVSINLGFINLLPVPMLDGGHLFFYAIEAVRRRPVAASTQEWAYRGGLAALLALMLLVTVNDLGSLGLWKGLAGLIG
jgi:regulator of sigma E protease